MKTYTKETVSNQTQLDCTNVRYGFYIRKDGEVVHNSHGYISLEELNADLEVVGLAEDTSNCVNKYLYSDPEDPQVEFVFEGSDSN